MVLPGAALVGTKTVKGTSRLVTDGVSVVVSDVLRAPVAWNATCATPKSSVTRTVTVTGLPVPTVAPLEGEMIVAVGGVSGCTFRTRVWNGPTFPDRSVALAITVGVSPSPDVIGSAREKIGRASCRERREIAGGAGSR